MSAEESQRICSLCVVSALTSTKPGMSVLKKVRILNKMFEAKATALEARKKADSLFAQISPFVPDKKRCEKEEKLITRQWRAQLLLHVKLINKQFLKPQPN